MKNCGAGGARGAALERTRIALWNSARRNSHQLKPIMLLDCGGLTDSHSVLVCPLPCLQRCLTATGRKT